MEVLQTCILPNGRLCALWSNLSKIDNKGYALGSGDFGINKSLPYERAASLVSQLVPPLTCEVWFQQKKFKHLF